MIKSDNANALQVQLTVGDPPSGGDGDGGGDGGGEEDEKCPEDPGDYTNSQIYTYTCGNDFIESPGLNAKNTILAVFYSTFTKIQPKDKNDANEFIIKVLTSKEMATLKEPMKMIGCDFKECLYHQSQLVYIESVETSRKFEIKNCTFDKCQGGITIKANKACFEIQYCQVNEQSGAYGFIRYESISATSSNVLLEDPKESEYLVKMDSCSFNIASTNSNGAALLISITDEEPAKPFLISNCKFKNVHAYAGDEDLEYGGSIYFKYSPKTLLEGANNNEFILKVADCSFEEGSTTCYGGAIYLSVSKELSKPIEINNCIFRSNKADNSQYKTDDGSGGDIYYEYISTDASTAEGQALKIINCDFNLSSAHDVGGSLYLVVNGPTSKSIEITGCKFYECLSEKGNGIDIVSNQQKALFKFTDCDFQWKSSINFKAISGEIENCNFSEMSQPIRYESNYDATANENSPSFKITKCKFNQRIDNTHSLLSFVPKSSSNFIFQSNDIVFTNNDSTFVIDSDSFTTLVGQWVFQGNTLTGANYKRIKTGNAQLIPAECEHFGLKCPSICKPNERCEVLNEVENDETIYETENLNIESSTFTGLKYENVNGGAISLKNWGLTVKGSHFDGCEAQTEGKAGGGIYIYVEEPMIYSITIETTEFQNCKATYGGGIYAYCSLEDKIVTIKSCHFTSNEASETAPTTGDTNLFGGSAIFLSTKKSIVIKSKFKSNPGTGMKVYNPFTDTSSKILNSESSISVSDCEFEVNEKSTSSLIYAGGINDDIPTKVENCVFTGKLSKNAHYIDGTTLNGKKKNSPKLVVHSCKFSDELQNALNVNVATFDMKSLQFKSNKAEKSSSMLKIPFLPLLAVIGTVAVAVIVGVAITLFKKNDVSQEEEELNEA